MNNPRAGEKVFELIETYDLLVPFQVFYPADKKRCRKYIPPKQTRLDFFLIARSFYNNVKK